MRQVTGDVLIKQRISRNFQNSNPMPKSHFTGSEREPVFKSQEPKTSKWPENEHTMSEFNVFRLAGHLTYEVGLTVKFWKKVSRGPRVCILRPSLEVSFVLGALRERESHHLWSLRIDYLHATHTHQSPWPA